MGKQAGVCGRGGECSGRSFQLACPLAQQYSCCLTPVRSATEPSFSFSAGTRWLFEYWEMTPADVCEHREDGLKNAVAVVLPHLEIYNSKLTQEYGLWAIAVCAGIFGADQPGLTPQAKNVLAGVTSLDLSNRNLQSLSPHVGPWHIVAFRHFKCMAILVW